MMFYGELAEFFVQDGRLRPRREFIDSNTGRDTFFDRSVQGKRIAVNHFDYLARPMAASEKYDVIFYGHNHRRRHERFGSIDIINPGAIMGYDGPARRDIPSTFVIYDTGNATASWYAVATVIENDTVKHIVQDDHVPIEPFTLSP
jgi:predicted phosphodiesterase